MYQPPLDSPTMLDGDAKELGWSRMAHIIRGVDEAKIKDYKEDIDTFLVFVSGSRILSHVYQL